MPHITTRIQDTEASLGEKIFLFEIIGQAAIALSEQAQTEETSKPKNQKLYEHILSDNEFFKSEDE